MAARLQLWRRKIPRFPLYFKGDPQRQILLPQFWMKLLQPKEPIPPDTVHFEIHPQMGKSDVQQYLEKIYQVDVAQVRTEVRRGLKVRHVQSRHRHEDQKYAYVQLLDGKFEFPDLKMDEKHKNRMKQEDEYRKKSKQMESGGASVKDSNQGVPRWFR